tara:strand:- start:175 stop:312 length:138 start_codon:yes stop_codon:yes gene_type:complete
LSKAERIPVSVQTPVAVVAVPLGPILWVKGVAENLKSNRGDAEGA